MQVAWRTRNMRVRAMVLFVGLFLGAYVLSYSASRPADMTRAPRLEFRSVDAPLAPRVAGLDPVVDSTPPTGAENRIKITVVDALTTLPVQGALVGLWTPTPPDCPIVLTSELLASGSTDPQGEATLQAPPTTVTVVVASPRHLIHVSPLIEECASLRVALRMGEVIRGTVRDRSGSPVPNVFVRAFGRMIPSRRPHSPRPRMP